jgi:hypothetical protein
LWLRGKAYPCIGELILDIPPFFRVDWHAQAGQCHHRAEFVLKLMRRAVVGLRSRAFLLQLQQ